MFLHNRRGLVGTEEGGPPPALLVLEEGYVAAVGNGDVSRAIGAARPPVWRRPNRLDRLTEEAHRCRLIVY